MTVRRLAEKQPDSFEFTPDNQVWCEKQIAKYPEGRQASAVIPLLWRAQAQHEYWLPQKAIEKVAEMLDMSYIRVLEIATFYSMFNLEPVGQHFIQLCGTTPCMLRGSNDIKAVLEKRIGPQRQVSADGKFSWLEVECLGACCNAPMVQINDDYYEDLTAENFGKLLDDLAAGREVRKGSQTGRTSSEPEPGKADTLTDPSLYDGSAVGAWKKRFEEERRKAEEAARAEEAAKKEKEQAKEDEAKKTEAGTGKASGAAAAPSGAPATAGDGKGAEAGAPSGSGAQSAGASGSTPAAAGSPNTGASAQTGSGGSEPTTAFSTGSAVGGEQKRAASGGSGDAPPPPGANVSTPAEVSGGGSNGNPDNRDGAADEGPVDAAAEEADIKALLANLGKDATPEEKANAVGSKPGGLDAPRGGVADDLKRVKGIGKVNEGKLNDLGIFHFDQIAQWTRGEIRWVGTYLAFPGRIDREDWTGQAKVLASGGDTDFSQRVDAGEVSTSAGGASRPDKTK